MVLTDQGRQSPAPADEAAEKSAGLELARRAVPGVLGVSITARQGDEYSTLEALPFDVADLDALQYAADSGPCIDAIIGDVVVDASLRDKERHWPTFAPLARARGFERVISTPMGTIGEGARSLNLYSVAQDPLDEAEREIVDLLTAVLAKHEEAQRDLAAAKQERDHLLIALETRERIGEAKGILMATRGCTSEEAFDLLRRESQRSNRKLRDVASEISGRPG